MKASRGPRFRLSATASRNVNIIAPPFVTCITISTVSFAHDRLLVLSLISLAMLASPISAEWKAGVASAVITPPESMWMDGFASRDKPSEGVAQDLRAKALAIEDGEASRLVIVTMDLVSVPRVIRLGLEKRLAEALDLPPEGLLVNASHTHCGPRVRVLEGEYESRDPTPFKGGDSDAMNQQVRRYVRQLENQLFEVASQALTGMSHAELAYGTSRAGFAMNRRGAPGTRRAPYPAGPVDHDVPVLQVRGPDGETVAVLFGYACHNTTLGSSFRQFHGDYAGYAQRFVEGAYPGAVALFLAGAGADQNPNPRGEGVYGQSPIDLARQHGRTLANAVFAALVAEPEPIRGSLKSALGYVELEYEPVDPARLEEVAKSGGRHERVHAGFVLEDVLRDRLALSYSYPVQVIRLGDGPAMIALAGEAVVDYSLRLKQELGPGPVWVAAYSNDGNPLYIPSHRVLAEGGYEGRDAQWLVRSVVHPAQWADGIEEKIVATVHHLHENLD